MVCTFREGVENYSDEVVAAKILGFVNCLNLEEWSRFYASPWVRVLAVFVSGRDQISWDVRTNGFRYRICVGFRSYNKNLHKSVDSQEHIL
jgi:hypothetical protein